MENETVVYYMALGVQLSGMNNEKYQLENVPISNNSSTIILICQIILKRINFKF
jgi:hypothetical protein